MCKPRFNYVLMVQETAKLTSTGHETYSEALAAAKEYVDDDITVTVYQAVAVVGEKRSVDTLWTAAQNAGVL